MPPSKKRRPAAQSLNRRCLLAWGSCLALFLSFGNKFVGALLDLFIRQSCAAPVDTFAICVDAVNIQRFDSSATCTT